MKVEHNLPNDIPNKPQELESKQTQPLLLDGQIIIEEKQNKPNGEVNIIRYIRGSFLGKGGFAKCYEFTRIHDKKIFAGKMLQKSSLTKTRARQKLLSEIKIHRSLVHRHIVGFEHFFEDYENVYILLELCRSQSLNELLRRRKRLHELEVQCYTYQIVQALQYMHIHKVIHRDLKLGNLFLNDKMEVKIGDFGLATKLEFEGDKKRTICGTPNYIAPEILEGKSGHSYEVDVWSLGVIIYTFLYGKPPFETSDVKSTYCKIKKNQYSFPEHVKVSKQAKDMISKILVLDPAKRLTLEQILEHDFFRIGKAIPKNLPVSTISCPLPENYIKQFMPNLHKQGSALNLLQNDSSQDKTKDQRKNLREGLMTDRGNRRGNTVSPENPDINRRIQSITPEDGISGNQWDDLEEPYVVKHLDYSNKYGIGFKLTTDSVGVYFNDKTKVVMASDQYNLQYFENDQEKKQQPKQFNTENVPFELNKKVTLLVHFKTYMEGKEAKQSPKIKLPIDIANQEPCVYIKKYLKTKQAIIFRLSNKVIQVIFHDETQIIMSSITKKVLYINKRQDHCHYTLSNALESGNNEMIKRLNYARQVLEQSLKREEQKEAQPLTQRASSNQARTDRPQKNEVVGKQRIKANKFEYKLNGQDNQILSPKVKQ